MMMKSALAALLVAPAAAKDLSLTWKDCGTSGTKTKITSFSPASITLGEKTTMTGKGDLSEDVTGATFDLTMNGALGQLLHCTGDASVSKTCNLPLGTGSLTFEAMKFPIAAGTVPVNVDISLSSSLPTTLAKTKTTTKATAKNGDDLFCIEIDSAAASSEQEMQDDEPLVQGGNLKLDWSDCGDSSTHAKVTGLSPAILPIGQKTTVTGSGNVDKQVTEGAFTITAKFGVTEHYSGDICAEKVFHLPLGVGVITWDGLKCPVAQGSVSVGVDVQLSSLIPARLAKGDISIKAAETSGSQDKLICLDIKTSAAQTSSAAVDSAPAGSKQDDVPLVQGGNLKLDWSDCGDSSTHAKVTGLSPAILPIGQKTTVTGSGNVDKQVTEGAFTITAKFGVTEHYSGDICAEKVFHLPLGVGVITWDGLKCPVAQGSVSVGVDVQLSSLIPARLAKGDISIKAAETSGSQDKLICLDIKTSAEQTIVV